LLAIDKQKEPWTSDTDFSRIMAWFWLINSNELISYLYEQQNGDYLALTYVPVYFTILIFANASFAWELTDSLMFGYKCNEYGGLSSLDNST
jgi:hypothetical protein